MLSFVFVSATPIFPGSRPPSIVGADELNYCVRHGNRWNLIAIVTDLKLKITSKLNNEKVFMNIISKG